MLITTKITVIDLITVLFKYAQNRVLVPIVIQTSFILKGTDGLRLSKVKDDWLWLLIRLELVWLKTNYKKKTQRANSPII